MKTIAFINQKGGVGKTTSTVNVGTGLARLGHKVLLIDFDPQANLTYAFGIQPDGVSHSVYDALQLSNDGKYEELAIALLEISIVKKGKLFLLPSSIGLSAFENDYKDHPEKEFLFKKLLETITGFDYVLVDCPPSLGLLTINVLSAVQEVYIPVQTEFFALQGLGQIFAIMQVVTQRLNPTLKLGKIIGTKFNNRKLHKDVIGYLKTNFKDAVFKTVIRENIALAEAPSFGKDIYSYSPASIGAQDYSALCKEIIKFHETEVAP